MSSLLSTVTTTLPATITTGPKINDLQFQGWYVHPEGSLEAIDCPTGQSWISTSDYAVCCNIGGASTCSTLWTTCVGNTAVGVGSTTCGSSLTCQTMSIFDQFPINDNVVHSQIICAPKNWAAFSIYRTFQSTQNTTVTSTIYVSAASAQTGSQSTLVSTTGTAASTSQSTTSGSAVPTQVAQSTTSQAWIAGAAVGPVVFLALLIAGVFAFFALRKRRRRQRQEATLPAYSMDQVRSPGYTSADTKVTVDYTPVPSELQSDREPHELPGNFSSRS